MNYASFVPLVLALSAVPAMADSASYSDFSSTAGLTLNGTAAQAGSVLRLVPSSGSVAGSAYLSSAVGLNAATGFSSAFKFNVGIDPASSLGLTDGFAFVLQSVGPTALGSAGEGMGYEGISPSVEVIFRGRAPSVIGVITGGLNFNDVVFAAPSAYLGTEGEFYGGDRYAWIDYVPGNLKVFLSSTSSKPGTEILSASVDVFGTLGVQTYVGFSAGNGGAFASQDIQSWQFNTTPVPEPASAVMLALGVAALGLLRRRART